MPTTDNIFLGHSMMFWLDLKRRVELECPIDTEKLLEEIVYLRGRLNYYESRISQMAGVMNSNESKDQ